MLSRVLTNQDNLEFALNISQTMFMLIDTVVGIIGLKLALGGPKDEENKKVNIQGNNVTIVDGENNTIYQTTTNVYHIYASNQTVNDAVSASFKALEEDEEIKAVSYEYGNKKKTFKRNSFSKLGEKRIVKIADEKVTNVVTDLVVSKVVLDNPNRKWQFVFQGTKISATIIDTEFWSRVLGGQESFANGDKLVCDLEIIREYNEKLGTFLNKDYIVNNVRDHRPREVAEQIEII